MSNATFAQDKDSIDKSNYQLLWKISGNGLENPQFLFGTYHSNDPDIFNFPDQLYSAIHNADAIILETDITELMGDDQYFDYPSFNYGNDIIDWIIPFSNRDRVTFTGYGSDNGRPQFIDLYFKQIADNCDKSFYPLESVEDQLTIGMNNEMDTTVEGYVDTPSKEEMKLLYLEGQASKLHDYTKLSTRRYLNLYEDLLVNRNHVMANGLDTLMKKEKVFCAVGAAHLMGPEGIVPILKEKGYTVEAVDAVFSTKKTRDEKELDKCSGYLYTDDKFGAKIEFSGKPLISNEENGSRLVQYREMGQGNTYTLNMHHYEVITDLDEVVRDYFTTEPEHISQYDSLIIGDGIMARQARIDRGGNNVYWMRAFHHNDILYTLYCTGGYRFVNSTRPFRFFETFAFKRKSNNKIELDSVLYSPSKTLSARMPGQAVVTTDKTESDSYWYSKWFDPHSKTSFYVYENQVTDNSLYLNDEEFGNYLVEEFHKDSIEFYGFNENDNYSEKSFTAQRHGRKIHGKMRLLGNVIHYAQHTGSDSTEARQFLENVKFIPPIKDSIPQQQKISNASLTSYLTRSGFSPEKYDEKYLYRTTKHYLVNDEDNVITFQAYKKDFQPWAFSDKSSHQLLSDQVIWPDSTVQVEIDSSFSQVDGNPIMEYTFHYTSSKNTLKGRVTINGKTIGTSNMIFPYTYYSSYDKLDYLDSMTFFVEGEQKMNTFDLQKIKQEFIKNGPKGIAQLVENDHVNSHHMREILLMHDSLFQQYDDNGFLQYTILFKLAGSDKNSIDPFELWKARANEDNPLLTEALLYYCAKQNDENAFNNIASGALNKNIPWENKEQLVAIQKSDPSFLTKVWSSFEPSILDSLSWKMSFLLADLSAHPFFKAQFIDKRFANAMLSNEQPEWAAFRYFEWIYKSEISDKEAFLDSLVNEWEIAPDEDFRMGIKMGWQNILDKKANRKLKKKVQENITRSIAYGKVMAISGDPQYDIFNFEEIIGLISFDHYEDSFYDPYKTIEVIDQFSLDDSNFVLYKCIENKKVYYLAQEIPVQRKLPSYKDFGEGAYFFFFTEKPALKELKEALLKRISE
jgi:uncharacterized protein YbaP (TraB family)